MYDASSGTSTVAGMSSIASIDFLMSASIMPNAADCDFDISLSASTSIAANAVTWLRSEARTAGEILSPMTPWSA